MGLTPCHICTEMGLALCHICTGTGLTSAPGPASPLPRVALLSRYSRDSGHSDVFDYVVAVSSSKSRPREHGRPRNGGSPILSCRIRGQRQGRGHVERHSWRSLGSDSMRGGCKHEERRLSGLPGHYGGSRVALSCMQTSKLDPPSVAKQPGVVLNPKP